MDQPTSAAPGHAPAPASPSLPPYSDAGPVESAGSPAGARLGARLGPVAMVVAGGLSVQFGSAVAVTIMPSTGAAGVVAVRLAVAAVLLLVVCRPKVRGYARADWWTVAAFGLAMAGMNGLFYQSLDRVPLGVAVTLEVLGPLALSVFASRRAMSVVWAALALGGVVLLSGGGFDRLDPVGAAYALGAGGCWAAYILFSARTGRRFPQADGLALAMAVAALLSLPFGIAGAGDRLLEPRTLALGVAVALMSSVLPYTLELLALRRLPAATFAVLMSLEPAIAAVAGFLVLHQALSTTDALAIALVIGASMGAVRSQARQGRRERAKSAE
ncbi:transporter [Streptomyces agglomeratus]|uniref:Transporter n=1 Tax=Streptomyces agglomeratus TaxID=285458 RepID=A0A1E5P9Y0_9ACTN|nr:EamA family transporter [Streptomyces agglomeratus]OEJ26361.1 transporter [Streptomyces agglomeratus]OEJ39579.1 transporter [Streptomyces agglomeratus]OEJ46037.1 transporter [Streptomyces agglomeratus]OEJ52142.1 transporter [Streptomyces agglomeratus]OEJ59501.1 transporter [Streptomyces agglomeratus]